MKRRAAARIAPRPSTACTIRRRRSNEIGDSAQPENALVAAYRTASGYRITVMH
jgi:hypothetical protein